MQHTETVRILKELFRQVDSGVSFDVGHQLKNPAKAYVCDELARQEWDTFFRHHPQLIGFSGDLAEPGSFMTLNDFGPSIIATRDGEGRFRAFLNACRHRATELVTQRRGQAQRFVCPFHGWTYTSDGKLQAITQAKDFGSVDRSCLGLVELPSLEHNGFLWVQPEPNGEISIESLLGGLTEELGEWQAGNRRLCGEKVFDKPLNWKLANDTFGETYHFARLHRNTLGQLFHGDAVCFDEFGRNHRFVFPSKGLYSLKRKPESEWRTENVTTVLYYLFPNIQITMSERQITLFRIYPLPGRPGWSRTRVSHYFSDAALAEIESGKKTAIAAHNVYDPGARDGNAIITPEAAMEVLYSTLENEDYAMAESTQRNIESGLIDHLIFGRNEPGLHHFHQSYREALALPPLEPS